MSGPLLPDFPVDDATLAAIEHSLGACITYEGEHGERLDEPRVIGADYQLSTLLDFLAGATGDDGLELIAGDPELHALGIGHPPTYMDERPHYSERDVIAALIAEVRRLRALSPVLLSGADEREQA